MPVQSQESVFLKSYRMSVFFMFKDLRWDVIIRFDDIGGTVYPHCWNFFCFVDIGGTVYPHCWNFLLFWWYWWNCLPSLLKLSFVLLILVELFTLTVETFFCFVNIGRTVYPHCWNFLFIIVCSIDEEIRRI